MSTPTLFQEIEQEFDRGQLAKVNMTSGARTQLMSILRKLCERIEFTEARVASLEALADVNVAPGPPLPP